MSTCSFQSASSWTRPCCIRTPLKWRAASNVARVMSPPVTTHSSGRVDDAGRQAGGQVFVESGAQVLEPLGLPKMVERAHLRAVGGTGRQGGRCATEAGVTRIAIAL